MDTRVDKLLNADWLKKIEDIYKINSFWRVNVSDELDPKQERCLKRIILKEKKSWTL